MSATEAETLAVSLKAIADPVRLRLISLVAAHEDGEACVCDLTEPVAFSLPTVSHHLTILVDAGILACNSAASGRTSASSPRPCTHSPA
jgi:ArsR family transcriptional regulator, arsenate/arsenite/antimonite-responsive transcriptional repressor